MPQLFSRQMRIRRQVETQAPGGTRKHQESNAHSTRTTNTRHQTLQLWQDGTSLRIRLQRSTASKQHHLTPTHASPSRRRDHARRTLRTPARTETAGCVPARIRPDDRKRRCISLALRSSDCRAQGTEAQRSRHDSDRSSCARAYRTCRS